MKIYNYLIISYDDKIDNMKVLSKIDSLSQAKTMKKIYQNQIQKKIIIVKVIK
jgi:hypothetical protein